jgi:hypothetical protein
MVKEMRGNKKGVTSVFLLFSNIDTSSGPRGTDPLSELNLERSASIDLSIMAFPAQPLWRGQHKLFLAEFGLDLHWGGGGRGA